jgi:hypothetical protein
MKTMMLGVAMLAAGALGACTEHQAHRTAEGGLLGATVGFVAGAVTGTRSRVPSTGR